jgi:hypothetical protein
MVRFSDLPTELELQGGPYPSLRDLAIYALVERRQSMVTREHRYKAPEILQPDEWRRLMLLLRTLFARPALMQEIRSLSLAIVDCSMSYNAHSISDESEKYRRRYWSYPSSHFWCLEHRDVQQRLIKLSSHLKAKQRI